MHGKNKSFEYVKKIFSYYAKKTNADLFISESPIFPAPKVDNFNQNLVACLDKFEIKNLLKKYDRVLYLDADIVINPWAPNIFDYYPDTSQIYMLNEGLILNRKPEINQICNAMNDEIAWPKKGFKYPYFNAGVILISKEQRHFFEKATLDDIDKFIPVHLFEQTYFNYILTKYNFNVSPLNKKFNHMGCFGNKSKRMKAFFMHYAADGFTGKYHRKFDLIIDDYWTFWAPILNDTIPKEKQTYYKKRKTLYKYHVPFTIPSLNYF